VNEQDEFLHAETKTMPKDIFELLEYLVANQPEGGFRQR